MVTWHRRRPAPPPRPRPPQAVLDALRALPGLRRHDAPGPCRGPDLRRNTEVAPVRPGRSSVGALGWAASEVIADTALTHARRPFGITAVPTTTGVVDVIEEVVDSTPFGTLLRFRKDTDVQGPRGADPRPTVGALRHPVDRHRGDDAPGPRRLHHRLVQRPRRPALRRTLRLRRVRRSRRAVPERARAGRAPARRVPAVRAGPDRHRGDGQERRPLRAPHAHADGRPHRHADQPDRGERPGHHPAHRVVRAERDHHGAVALPGSGRARCTRDSCSSRPSSP